MPAFVSGFDHDVFVSYAHVDNVSLSGKSEGGWVYTLKDHLRKLLDRELGRTDGCKLWIDRRLPGNEPFPDSIHQAVQNSATLLVVLSKGYLESDWCRREREAFLEATAKGAGAKGRIFLVRSTDLAHDRWPKPFHGLLGHEFFTKAREEDPARTLGLPYADSKSEASQLYFQRLDDLSRELGGQLEAMAETARCNGQQPSPAETYPISIFLAETTPDLTDFRDQIKRHLSQQQIGVLPDEFYDRTPSAFQSAMEADLERSKLFVQLLGRFVTPKVHDLPTGYEGLQLELARKADKQILRWHDPDLDRTQVQDPALLSAWDVMAMPFEDFKAEIVRQALRPDPGQDRPDVMPDEPLALIRVDDADSEIANQLTERLEQHDIAVDVVEDDDKLAVLAEDKEYPAHALMVIYGQCPLAWAKERIRMFRRIRRRRKPSSPAWAVYVDPGAREPLNIRFPSLHILSGLENGSPAYDFTSFCQEIKTLASTSQPGLS